LHRGEIIKMHLCNKKVNGCTEVEIQEFLTTEDNAWFDRINRLLVSIDGKIMRGEELDNEEVELINRTSIPLFKIINVLSYLHESYGTKSELASISEFLSMDVLCHYLEDCRLIVRRGARELMNRSIDCGFLKEYIASLDKAGERIRILQQEAKSKEQKFLTQLHLYLELDKEMDRKFSL
jgi:conjugative transfer pilus assembly protein TraH